MNVYADLRWPPKTGIGTVQSEILKQIPDDLQCLDLRVRERIGSPLSPFALAWSLREHPAHDAVFWSPGFMPPAWSAVPSVVTVHDLTHLHYYSTVHAVYYNALMRPFYRRCQAVICVSEFTRTEFLGWSGMSSDRVFTVHNGVHEEFFREGPAHNTGFPYVMYAGNHRSYKNLDRLIEAFAISSLPRNGIKLLITGNPDVRLRLLADRLKVPEHVQFTGVVTYHELGALYRGAKLVAFVSLYEGFGLPILEAMAASVPVLTSNVSAMPEIAGGAAFLVDPTSVEAICGGLEKLTYDDAEREQLQRLGRANAARFDWNETAAATWQIIRQLGR